MCSTETSTPSCTHFWCMLRPERRLAKTVKSNNRVRVCVWLAGEDSKPPFQAPKARVAAIGRPASMQIQNNMRVSEPCPRTHDESLIRRKGVAGRSAETNRGGFGQKFDRLSRAPQGDGVGGASLYFSPRGEAKCMRGPSGRGASRLARAGVLEQYVEHGKQAQPKSWRSYRFDRRVVRKCRLDSSPPHGSANSGSEHVPVSPWFRRLPPAIQVFRVAAANFRSARRHARTAAFILPMLRAG